MLDYRLLVQQVVDDSTILRDLISSSSETRQSSWSVNHACRSAANERIGKQTVKSEVANDEEKAQQEFISRDISPSVLAISLFSSPSAPTS